MIRFFCALDDTNRRGGDGIAATTTSQTQVVKVKIDRFLNPLPV